MTQEFVTLPREIVEQAICALYCTNSQEGSPAYNFELKAIKELRAALEQPQGKQEPRFFYDEEDALLWTPGEAQYGPEGMTALYTQPQPKRVPLTDGQIAEVLIDATNGRSTGIGFKTLCAFARAIEAAHNIK